MDGANPWTLLFRIYLPLSLPVLATITLFTIVNTWNEYFLGLIFIQHADQVPLQTYLQQLLVKIDPTKMTVDQIQVASKMSNKTLNVAKIFITMLPIMVIYPFLQRFFITGITLGSVKE
ncbi:MAG: carbohydrate ABC transporter permease [Gorillibacterium sp.]|nr:carbohydrate ABC transporter permease [Gorillibacterium sp.]